MPGPACVGRGGLTDAPGPLPRAAVALRRLNAIAPTQVEISIATPGILQDPAEGYGRPACV
jgi:hypothetical protein